MTYLKKYSMDLSGMRLLLYELGFRLIHLMWYLTRISDNHLRWRLEGSPQKKLYSETICSTLENLWGLDPTSNPTPAHTLTLASPSSCDCNRSGGYRLITSMAVISCIATERLSSLKVLEYYLYHVRNTSTASIFWNTISRLRGICADVTHRKTTEDSNRRELPCRENNKETIIII